MRTTKRFTPQVLRRFAREGRGEGAYAEYIGQHRVTRGDPASRGRSHILQFRGRLRDLLSDAELHQQLFASMLPDIDDCREQQALTLNWSPSILAEYGDANSAQLFPGTHELAAELCIRHPCVSAKNDTESWRLSTDLVLIKKRLRQRRTVLAVASKPEADLKSRRKCQLLEIEQAYWHKRGHDWMLVTERCYDRAVALTLRRIAPWALAAVVSQRDIRAAVEAALWHPGAPLSRVISNVTKKLDGEGRGQRALWPAVWTGALPIDLRRGWRPHLPLQHVPSEVFWNFNPIWARRSAWN